MVSANEWDPVIECSWSKLKHSWNQYYPSAADCNSHASVAVARALSCLIFYQRFCRGRTAPCPAAMARRRRLRATTTSQGSREPVLDTNQPEPNRYRIGLIRYPARDRCPPRSARDFASQHWRRAVLPQKSSKIGHNATLRDLKRAEECP
jgi:hypothetical protein